MEQPKPDVTPAAPGPPRNKHAAQPLPKWPRVICPECNKAIAVNRIEDHLWYIHQIDSAAFRSAGEEPASSTPSEDAPEQDWQRIAKEQSQRAESLQNTLLVYICRNGEKDSQIARLHRQLSDAQVLVSRLSNKVSVCLNNLEKPLSRTDQGVSTGSKTERKIGIKYSSLGLKRNIPTDLADGI